MMMMMMIVVVVASSMFIVVVVAVRLNEMIKSFNRSDTTAADA